MHVTAEVVQRTITLNEIHQRQTRCRTRPLVHRKDWVVRKENRRNPDHQRVSESARIPLQYGFESIQIVRRETSVEMAQGKLVRIESDEAKRSARRLKHFLVDRRHIR